LQPARRPIAVKVTASTFVAVSRLGLRTRSPYLLQPAPRPARAYRIFGAEVISPCNGEVMVARDGMVDQPAGEANFSSRRHDCPP